MLTACGWTAACGGNPMGPGPQPLTLACPGPITLEAASPAGAPVSFSAPSPIGGQQPLTTECTPPSGTVFPLGTTSVICTARDANQREASCNFTVNVRVSRSLARTRFLAFGDSITAGQVSPPATLIINPDSYPYKLEERLRQRYPAQEIVVLNDGRGGERLDQGVRRLPGVLDAEQPQVLLLLEGIVEVRNIPTSTNARHLENMILAARQRSVDVILATVMPVGAGLEAKEPGINRSVRALNEEIRRLADRYGLGAPVDLFAIFDAEPSLIGRDQLHPTAEGFTRIAEAFLDAVVSRYDDPPSTARRVP